MREALGCPSTNQGSAYGAGNASDWGQRATARRQVDSMDSKVRAEDMGELICAQVFPFTRL